MRRKCGSQYRARKSYTTEGKAKCSLLQNTGGGIIRNPESVDTNYERLTSLHAKQEIEMDYEVNPCQTRTAKCMDLECMAEAYKNRGNTGTCE